MRVTRGLAFEIDTGEKVSEPIDCREFDTALLQAVDAGTGLPATAVLEIKRSLSGRQADAVSFSTAKVVSLTDRAILEIDLAGEAWLHYEITTTEAAKRVTLFVHLIRQES